MHTENNKDKNLYYLNELSDYEVSDSDKDVRDWKVKDANGESIGTVDNLIISKKDNRVVYLDMEVDESLIEAHKRPQTTGHGEETHNSMNEDGENHLIIPIGMVNLDLDNEIVHTPKLNKLTLIETRRIGKGSLINREYETDVLESYNRDSDMDFTSAERDANDTELYKRNAYRSGNRGV